jgi:hypothetical protein
VNHSSAGSFCSLVVATTTGAVDSITSLNVAARGDGAECYCIANQALYRYNANSTQVAVPNTDAYLVPLSGGGCWFRQNTQGLFGEQIITSTSFNGAVFGGLAQNVWHVLPFGANFFAAVIQSALFNMSTTSGVINYVGPTGLSFLLNAMLSVSDDNPVGGRTDQTIEFAVTENSSIIGTTTASAKQSSASVSGLSGNLTQISLDSILTPQNGSNIQHALRCISPSPGTFTASRYSVVITPLA